MEFISKNNILFKRSYCSSGPHNCQQCTAPPRNIAKLQLRRSKCDVMEKLVDGENTFLIINSQPMLAHYAAVAQLCYAALH